MRSFNEAALRSVIADYVGVEVRDRLADDWTFRDDLGFDSLNTVELAMAIEDRFDILIEDSDLEETATIGDLVALVKRRTAQGVAA